MQGAWQNPDAWVSARNCTMNREVSSSEIVLPQTFKSLDADAEAAPSAAFAAPSAAPTSAVAGFTYTFICSSIRGLLFSQQQIQLFCHVPFLVHGPIWSCHSSGEPPLIPAI